MTAPEPTLSGNTPQTTLRPDTPRKITDALLERPLDGYQLSGNTLADLVKDRTTLLVFLRHFG